MGDRAPRPQLYVLPPSSSLEVAPANFLQLGPGVDVSMVVPVVVLSIVVQVFLSTLAAANDMRAVRLLGSGTTLLGAAILLFAMLTAASVLPKAELARRAPIGASEHLPFLQFHPMMTGVEYLPGAVLLLVSAVFGAADPAHSRLSLALVRELAGAAAHALFILSSVSAMTVSRNVGTGLFLLASIVELIRHISVLVRAVRAARPDASKPGDQQTTPVDEQNATATNSSTPASQAAAADAASAAWADVSMCALILPLLASLFWHAPGSRALSHQLAELSDIYNREARVESRGGTAETKAEAKAMETDSLRSWQRSLLKGLLPEATRAEALLLLGLLLIEQGALIDLVYYSRAFFLRPVKIVQCWFAWALVALVAYRALHLVGQLEFAATDSEAAPAPGMRRNRQLTGAHTQWAVPPWPRREAPRELEEQVLPRALRFFQHPSWWSLRGTGVMD